MPRSRRSLDVICYITVDDHDGSPPYEATARLHADIGPDGTLVWSESLGDMGTVRHVDPPPPYPVLDQLVLTVLEQRLDEPAIAS